MDSIFRYLVLANGFILFQYLFYKIFLARETRLHWNRGFILGGLLLAMIAPLVPQEWMVFLGLPILTLPSIAIGPQGMGIPILLDEVVISSSQGPGSGWPRIVAVIYVLGVSFMLASLVYGWFRLLRWRNRYPAQRVDGHKITVLQERIQVFSFMNRIYFPQPFDSDDRYTRLVLQHESVHIRQWHTLDLFVVELIRILFFFNPFIHLIKKEMQLTHEYLADRVNGGDDCYTYTLTLFTSQFKVPHLSLIHPFTNKSFLQRRFTMLSKNYQNSKSIWRYFLIVPLIAGFILAASCTQNEGPLGVTDKLEQAPKLKSGPAEASEVFYIVEEMPQFKGGGLDDFRNWVQLNIKYPAIAMENGISGTVYVQFEVNSQGRVENVKIVRGVDPALDNEVMRVLAKAPAWTSGKQRGIAVSVAMSIPVKFLLQ